MEGIELLKTTGVALFGPRWKAPLAAHIGVTRETVSRWCSGAAALPEWALLFLREVVKARERCLVSVTEPASCLSRGPKPVLTV